MALADFEYRFYEGKIGKPTLLMLFDVVNLALSDVTVSSRTPVRSSLEQARDNVVDVLSFYVPDIAQRADEFLNQVPGDLYPPRISEKFLEGEIKDSTGLFTVKVRAYIKGDWEFALGDATLQKFPSLMSPLDPQSGALKIMVTLARFVLRDFRIDVEHKVLGKWRNLASIPITDGSKLENVRARISLPFSVDPPKHELIPGSGQKFRKLVLTFGEADLSADDVDLNVGGGVPDWILDGLNWLATKVYDGLDFYQAIANRVLEFIEQELPGELPVEIPGLLELPAETAVGASFNAPDTERQVFLFNPGVDVTGSTSQQWPRTIVLHHQPPPPGGIDPDDLFDPDRLGGWKDKLIDSIHITEMLGFDPRIITEIPQIPLGLFTQTAIPRLIRQFAGPRFKARDASLLHLLRDGVPVNILANVRWRDVDLQKGAVSVKAGQKTRKFKISKETVAALEQLRKSFTATPRTRSRSSGPRLQIDPKSYVFAVKERPIGPAGLSAIALSYRSVLDLWGKVKGAGQSGERSPLPEHLPEEPADIGSAAAALGYAVNGFVPTAQFDLFNRFGGLDLAETGVAAAEFIDVYPSLNGYPRFTAAMSGSPQVPVLNFSTNTLPVIGISGIPLRIRIDAANEQPLEVSVNIEVELTPCFAKCDKCFEGKEDMFLALVRNLACLAEAGVLELKSNPFAVLQCLIYPHFLCLKYKQGSILGGVSTATVSAPGSFPPEGGPGETQALVARVMDRLLSQTIAVPVLYDSFHVIPQAFRGAAAASLIRSREGWLTLVQPLVISTSGEPGETGIECS